jgi:hypothetical protein
VEVLYTAAAEDSYLDAAIHAALQVRRTRAGRGGPQGQPAGSGGRHEGRAVEAGGGGGGGPLPFGSRLRCKVYALPALHMQVHCEEGPGDILVFLTGQDEIESCQRLLEEAAAALPPDPARPALLPLPIYAALPPDQQLRVFQPAPPSTRKVHCLRGWLAAGGGSSPTHNLPFTPLPPSLAPPTSALLAGLSPVCLHSFLAGCSVHQHRGDLHHHPRRALRAGHRLCQGPLLLAAPGSRLPPGVCVGGGGGDWGAAGHDGGSGVAVGGRTIAFNKRCSRTSCRLRGPLPRVSPPP